MRRRERARAAAALAERAERTHIIVVGPAGTVLDASLAELAAAVGFAQELVMHLPPATMTVRRVPF